MSTPRSTKSISDGRKAWLGTLAVATAMGGASLVGLAVGRADSSAADTTSDSFLSISTSDGGVSEDFETFDDDGGFEEDDWWGDDRSGSSSSATQTQRLTPSVPTAPSTSGSSGRTITRSRAS